MSMTLFGSGIAYCKSKRDLKNLERRSRVKGQEGWPTTRVQGCERCDLFRVILRVKFQCSPEMHDWFFQISGCKQELKLRAEGKCNGTRNREYVPDIDSQKGESRMSARKKGPFVRHCTLRVKPLSRRFCEAAKNRKLWVQPKPQTEAHRELLESAGRFE